MATSAAMFVARFPEFADVDVDRIQIFLDDAELTMVSETKWLGYFNVAHAYKAAHFLAIGQVTETGDIGVVGPISKQEVDDVVIEQAISSVSPTAEEFLSTSYGKRYIMYRKLCFTGPIGV